MKVNPALTSTPAAPLKNLQKGDKMATWCVYHLIHVQTPYQHLPKLVIYEVPDDQEVTEVLVVKAGYGVGGFGIPWANHILDRVDPETSPADLVGHIRRGECEDRISFADLVERATAPL